MDLPTVLNIIGDIIIFFQCRILSVPPLAHVHKITFHYVTLSLMKNQDWVETSKLFNNNIVWQVSVWLVDFPHARAACAVKSISKYPPQQTTCSERSKWYFCYTDIIHRPWYSHDLLYNVHKCIMQAIELPFTVALPYIHTTLEKYTIQMPSRFHTLFHTLFIVMHTLSTVPFLKVLQIPQRICTWPISYGSQGAQTLPTLPWYFAIWTVSFQSIK